MTRKKDKKPQVEQISPLVRGLVVRGAEITSKDDQKGWEKKARAIFGEEAITSLSLLEPVDWHLVYDQLTQRKVIPNKVQLKKLFLDPPQDSALNQALELIVDPEVTCLDITDVPSKKSERARVGHAVCHLIASHQQLITIKVGQAAVEHACKDVRFLMAFVTALKNNTNFVRRYVQYQMSQIYKVEKLDKTEQYSMMFAMLVLDKLTQDVQLNADVNSDVMYGLAVIYDYLIKNKLNVKVRQLKKLSSNQWLYTTALTLLRTLLRAGYNTEFTVKFLNQLYEKGEYRRWTSVDLMELSASIEDTVLGVGKAGEIANYFIKQINQNYYRLLEIDESDRPAIVNLETDPAIWTEENIKRLLQSEEILKAIVGDSPFRLEIRNPEVLVRMAKVVSRQAKADEASQLLYMAVSSKEFSSDLLKGEWVKVLYQNVASAQLVPGSSEYGQSAKSYPLHPLATLPPRVRHVYTPIPYDPSSENILRFVKAKFNLAVIAWALGRYDGLKVLSGIHGEDAVEIFYDLVAKENQIMNKAEFYQAVFSQDSMQSLIDYKRLRDYVLSQPYEISEPKIVLRVLNQYFEAYKQDKKSCPIDVEEMTRMVRSLLVASKQAEKPFGEVDRLSWESLKLYLHHWAMEQKSQAIKMFSRRHFKSVACSIIFDIAILTQDNVLIDGLPKEQKVLDQSMLNGLLSNEHLSSSFPDEMVEFWIGNYRAFQDKRSIQCLGAIGLNASGVDYTSGSEEDDYLGPLEP